MIIDLVILAGLGALAVAVLWIELLSRLGGWRGSKRH